MLRNLEQAIADVLATKQTPEFANVFKAYYKLYNNQGDLHDINFYFQIALDKYPHAAEKIQSLYAPLIANIRKECIEEAIDAAVSTFGAGVLYPCPCKCGELLDLTQLRGQLELKYGPAIGKIHLRRTVLGRMSIYSEHYPDHFALPKWGSIKKNSKRRRVAKTLNERANKRSQSPKLAFDPFGPSTSGTSM